MPAIFIANPPIGKDGQASADDRYAGVSSVRSDGRFTQRREGAVYVAGMHSDIASYVVGFNVAATVAMDIISLTSGSSLKILRLRRIVLVNPGSATAAALVDLQLGFAGALGSGGAVPTARPNDPHSRQTGVTGGPDPGAGTSATVHTGDTTQAVSFVAGGYDPLVTVSVPAAAAGFTPQVIYDARDNLYKPMTAINTGGSIVLRTPAVGPGAANLRGYVEFTCDDA